MHNAIALRRRAASMLDVQASADGQAMIFRDRDARMPHQRHRRASPSAPLAYLRALDIGHGYSADGGRTFPLRGRGVGGDADRRGRAPRLSARARSSSTSPTPRAADALVAAFAPRRRRDRRPSTASPARPAALARLRQLTRAGWIVDPAGERGLPRRLPPRPAGSASCPDELPRRDPDPAARTAAGPCGAGPTASSTG